MDWKNFLDNARNGFNELRKVTHETFEGFSQMGKPVKKDGDLSEKTKEFVALVSPFQLNVKVVLVYI